MVNGGLQIMQQQLAALAFDEKQKLADFLIEQLKQDRETNSKPVEPQNGHSADADDQLANSDPDPDRRLEYAWVKKHRDEYAGHHVALSGDQLIAAAPTLRELYELVKQKNAYRPFFVRIEAKDEPPFGGW